MENKLGSLLVTLTTLLLLGMMAQPRAYAQDGHIPLVTHTLGGVTTTNLDDNFESPASGNTPNNGAFPGSWGVLSGNGSTVQNWDASLSPNLAAFQGSQYARLERTGNNSAELDGNFDTSFSTGKLQIQFALRIFSYSPDFQENIVLDNGSYNANSNIRFSLVSKSDGSIQHYNGSAYVATGITGISTNDWQRWLIDVDLDNNRYNLTVDNQTALNLPFLSNGQSARLVFGAGNVGALLFVDALPEPTVAALVGIGGLLLRWRRDG
jgi:hypothetical protein